LVRSEVAEFGSQIIRGAADKAEGTGEGGRQAAWTRLAARCGVGCSVDHEQVTAKIAIAKMSFDRAEPAKRVAGRPGDRDKLSLLCRTQN